MIIQTLYANKLSNGSIELTQDLAGEYPAFLVDYEDGDKLLILAIEGNISFGNKVISFKLEQYNWNSKFNRWDVTDTSKFSSDRLWTVNSFLVDSVTGKWAEEMTETEKASATLIGEFAFWKLKLGDPTIIPQIMNSINKKLFPVV